MVALLVFVSQFQTVAAPPPPPLPWVPGWDSTLSSLSYSTSKVVFLANPISHVLKITYILNGAPPSTSFQVGVYILTTGCPAVLPAFGFTGLVGWSGAPASFCGLAPVTRCFPPPCFTISTGGIESMELGVLTTDSTGAGGFTTVQREITHGTYILKFDVRQGTGCFPSSPTNCLVVLQAPGPSFGIFATVTV